jgi:3-phenylpropionate/cinnamic acid dioxygenase small subunit
VTEAQAQGARLASPVPPGRSNGWRPSSNDNPRGILLPQGEREGVARLLLQHQAEQFLYREARYLDERRLTEWLDLFAEDAHYYMPIRRNIKYGDWDLEYSDPEREISYFDEGKDILIGRVRQLNTGVHWAEEPVSRFEHIISNVEILSDESDTLEVASKFYVYQNRLQDEVQIFCGRRYDLLRRDPETTFKIAKRKILLAQNVLLPKVINTFF